MASAPVDLSVVIPCFNEEANVDLLHERLTKALAAVEGLSRYEVVVVENGSWDRSWERLQAIVAKDPRVRVVRFTRNFGYQMAVTAGMRESRGAAVAVMDGDLQDPPEFLPSLWAKRREGYDIVYAVRATRKEGWFKQLQYKAFYRIFARMADFRIPLDAGDFAIYDRRVIDCLNRLPENNRFIRGLRAWSGYKHAGLPYDRDARHAGETKFSFLQALRLASDGIFSFSYVPLRMITAIGLLFAALSAVGIVVQVGLKVASVALDAPLTIRGLTEVNVLVMLFGGLELLGLGIVGEYVARVYEEVKRRPGYVVEQLFERDGGQGS